MTRDRFPFTPALTALAAAIALLLATAVTPGFADDRKRDRESDEAKLEEIADKLKAAVESGKMSEEEALKAWEAVSRRLKANREHKGGEAEGEDEDFEEESEEEWEEEDHAEEAFLEGVEVALVTAVELGKLSEQEAEQVWLEIEEAMEEEAEADEEEDRDLAPEGWQELEAAELYEAMAEGLEAAVELGKIGADEAREMWERLTAGEREDEVRERYEAMERGLRAAVELGKLSVEEAREMWRELTDGEGEDFDEG